VSRLYPYHRARRHYSADIEFAANKGRQNYRPRGELGVWKFFQIKAAGLPLLCTPAVRAAFVLVRRGFSISGESRQKHRIIKEADPHRRSGHRDENPEANREKSCKQSTHLWCPDRYVRESAESRGLFPVSEMTLIGGTDLASL
jgi:hypothetical protein